MPFTPPQTPVIEKGAVTGQRVDEDTGSSLFDDSAGNSTTLDEDAFTGGKNANRYWLPITPIEQKENIFRSYNDESGLLPPNATLLEKVSPNSDNSQKYERYELKSERLRKYVLSPQIFSLKLTERLGVGANSYVYEGILSSRGGKQLNAAVKIPASRNRVKAIENEAEFMILLQKFRTESGESPDSFPFVDSYGLYYLTRDDFAMIRKKDEIPCLVMRKMDCTLTKYIKECSKKTEGDQIVIGVDCWWKLCGTLLHALQILRELRSVHCDLKTDNIMVTDASFPRFRVSDFSSSSRIEDLTGPPETTLQFSPPEFFNIKDGANPSTQTDLFSTGLILLNAATGKAPYEAFSFDQFYLVTLIKENKVLEVLERETINILRSNKSIAQLIRMLVYDRCSLDSAVIYYNRNCRLHL
ncbi:DEKNAAC104970 [Brettanomyces naardenensis]|uniref:DEKNAAC104970 n=1 Tax=Brettanomyces naardenensis TaxID=13370 RepID=A0A448YSL2_BRENA|nr:DEKNAAC104970 [Brettanomyces naardenensis]